NVPPTTAIYPLSLHDALPICKANWRKWVFDRALATGTAEFLCHVFHGSPQTRSPDAVTGCVRLGRVSPEFVRLPVAYSNRDPGRSEEHTSELQSRSDLVCRLL